MFLRAPPRGQVTFGADPAGLGDEMWRRVEGDRGDDGDDDVVGGPSWLQLIKQTSSCTPYL
jgi:hypothetical protein